MATRSVKKVMTQPINLIFRFLQSRTRIQVWLYENTSMRIEGRIIGFDERAARRARLPSPSHLHHAHLGA